MTKPASASIASLPLFEVCRHVQKQIAARTRHTTAEPTNVATIHGRSLAGSTTTPGAPGDSSDMQGQSDGSPEPTSLELSPGQSKEQRI